MSEGARSDYYERYWQDERVGDSPHHQWKARVLREVVRRLEPRSVLDVGAGDGRMLDAAVPPSVRRVGSEMAEDAVAKMRARGIEAVGVDLETGKLPFEDRAFEMVTCLDVLEHVFDPERVLGELRRVSAKHVVVCVPNAFNLANRVLYATGRHVDVMDVAHQTGATFSEHIRFFSVDLLERFLAAGGLRVTERHFYFPDAFTDPNMKLPRWATKLVTVPKLHERAPSLFALGFLYVCAV